MQPEVSVVNRHPHTVKDGYMGIQYVFEPGKKIVIPLAAAVHIFAFNVKNPVLRAEKHRRFGIYDAESGEQFLGNFDLKLVNYVAQEEDAEEPVREETPATEEAPDSSVPPKVSEKGVRTKGRKKE